MEASEKTSAEPQWRVAHSFSKEKFIIQSGSYFKKVEIHICIYQDSILPRAIAKILVLLLNLTKCVLYIETQHRSKVNCLNKK